MQRITNIKFLSLEFDFGYFKDNENSIDNLGRIDAEVFVEIENEGNVSTITHRTELQNVSFSDFIAEEDKENIIKNTDSFGEFIQILRTLIALKVASDLNMEIADIDYVVPTPLREEVEDLKTRQDSTEDALLTLLMTI